MSNKTKDDIIYNRRHVDLKKYEKVNRKTLDTYNNDIDFKNGNYLVQHSLESNKEYKKRKEMAVSFGFTTGLVDILNGFISEDSIKRTFDEKLSYIVGNATPTESLASFIDRVAILSSLFTVAVLVDSPVEASESITVADREENKINPYCKVYLPFQIRDYSMDENNKLEWIMFDDSYVDKSNPLSEPIKKEVYTLWEKGLITKYHFRKENNKVVIDDEVVIEVPNLTEIPVHLTAFRDLDKNGSSESFASNIADLDISIYNKLSLLDMLLAKNAIKPLLYPVGKDRKIPKEIIQASDIHNLIGIPFNDDSKHTPKYLESGGVEIEAYLKVINIYTKRAFEKIGLTDNEKSAVSGKARLIELKKLEVILRSGATSLENLENNIFKFCNMWESANYDYKVEYPRDFQSEDVDEVIGQLQELMMWDSPTLKGLTIKEILMKVFKDLDSKTLDIIVKEIEGGGIDSGEDA